MRRAASIPARSALDQNFPAMPATPPPADQTPPTTTTPPPGGDTSGSGDSPDTGNNGVDGSERGNKNGHHKGNHDGKHPEDS